MMMLVVGIRCVQRRTKRSRSLVLLVYMLMMLMMLMQVIDPGLVFVKKRLL
jgi:hypothetical protein